MFDGSGATLFGYEAVSSFILSLGLLTVFALIWVTRQQKTKKDLNIWMASGMVGLLLGAAGVTAATHGLGFQVTEIPPKSEAATAGATSPAGGMPAPGTAGPPGVGMVVPGGGGMGGPGGGGGMMGGMTGGGGMGGGGRGPSPKRQLTTLVRKLELLTGDVGIALSDEQKIEVAKRLDEFAELKSLTDEDAEKKYKELLVLLDDGQKAKQDAVGLPFRIGGGGGGGGFGGGGFGGSGQQPAPDANPFDDEAAGKALKSLRERVKGATAQ